MNIDKRTKPESEWTYYVVGHLPTMEDFYRVDTVREAMDIYRSFPEDRRSAIGASINGRSELDLIHRREGNTPVLVTDFKSPSVSPEWRGKEIQDAIDLLIAELNVQHQYNSNIFGGSHRTIIVDLERYTDDHMDPYFADKQLLPVKFAENLYPYHPNKFMSAINEIYVRGEGWLALDSFLNHLDNSRPAAPGQPAKDVFVERLNIAYKNEHGYEGQADISPREFKLLQAKAERELEVGEKKTPLNAQIQSAEKKAKAQTQGQSAPERSPER